MLVSLVSLWLPILLSGGFAWVASALIHMFLKYHNSDYKKLKQEDSVAAALLQSADLPGIYSTPYCKDMKDMSDPVIQQRFTVGPVALITIMYSGMPPMGKLLGQQMLFFILGSVLVAYLGGLVLVPGEATMHVFHIVFIITFLTYAWASVPYSIWFGHPWSVTFKYFIDAAIYTSVTATTFA